MLVTSFLSYSFSILCGRFNICQVHDFSPLNPACSYSDLSTMSFILLRINNCSSNLYVWHKREIGRTFFASMGCLFDFINGNYLAFSPYWYSGIFYAVHILLYMCNKSSFGLCPKFFICSVLISVLLPH